MKEQQNNRRNSKRYPYHGKLLPLSTISELSKINVHTLSSRLRRKMPFDEAFSLPVKRRK